MADEKVSDLTDLAAPADDVYIPVVHDPGGSPASRRATLTNLLRMGHGSVSVTGASSAQVLAVDTWEKLTPFDTEVSGVNVTASHANDKLTLTNAGTYQVQAQVTFNMAGAETVRLAFYWNAAQAGPYVEQTVAGTEVISLNLSWQLVAGVAAADLELWVRSVGGADITVREAHLIVHRIY